MVSTYTPNLSLEIPAHGDYAAPGWDNPMDNSLNALDTSYGAYLGLTLSGGTHQLTTTEASSPVIGIGGTLSSNQYLYFPPISGQRVLLVGLTLNGYTLYVSGNNGSGDTITIPPGTPGTFYTIYVYPWGVAWANATQAGSLEVSNLTVDNSLTTQNATINGTLSINNLSVSGAISCATFWNNPTFTGNVVIDGALTCYGSTVTLPGAVTCGSGTVNGGWVVNGQLNANGNLVTQGNIYVDYTATSGQYILSADSNGRYIFYAPSWYWTWATSGGLLSWSTPGGSGGTEWAPFQIDVAGNVSYAGSLIHISDATAKENIAPFEGDPLAIVKKIPVKLYNLLGKPERHLGFIAQDVRTIMPEAVTPTKDDVLGVNESRLIAVLWSAVQKLSVEVADLKARLPK